MNIKIATAPCSWGVWYADGTPSGTPADLFLEQAEQAGYVALELGPDGYLPTDAETLRSALSTHHLEACAGTVCYQFDQYESFEGFRDRLDSLCRRMQSVGAKWLVTMDESDVGTHSEKKEDMDEAVWTRFLTMVRDMAEYAKREYDIQVVFHPHVRTMIETEAEIERLMDFTGLPLCFDIGHHAYANGGSEPGDTSALDFIRKWADKIQYLHFKNVDGAVRKKVMDEGLGSDDAFDLDVMCDLKDGIVDYEALRDLLEEIGFEGIGVIEQDMPRATNAQAFAAAKRNLEYLRSIHMIG